MKSAMGFLRRALALLLACALPFGGANAQTQPSGDSGCGMETDENQYQICKVHVSVAAGIVVADPPLLYVGNKVFTINRRIVWILDTSGYTFKSDSIGLKPGGNANIGEFELKDDTHFRAHLRHWVLGLCQGYGIAVYDKATAARISLDPVIANSYGLNALGAGGC